MSFAATLDEATLFPMEQVSTRSAVMDAASQIKQFAALSHEHGGLLTQAQAALMLGLSRSRIGDFIEEGRLTSVTMEFWPGTDQASTVRFVPGQAVLEFLTRERSKGGRPSKTRMLMASFDMT
jgi:hypothetical protein